jgi:hypothetical protein
MHTHTSTHTHTTHTHTHIGHANQNTRHQTRHSQGQNPHCWSVSFSPASSTSRYARVFSRRQTRLRTSCSNTILQVQVAATLALCIRAQGQGKMPAALEAPAVPEELPAMLDDDAITLLVAVCSPSGSLCSSQRQASRSEGNRPAHRSQQQDDTAGKMAHGSRSEFLAQPAARWCPFPCARALRLPAFAPRGQLQWRLGGV